MSTGLITFPFLDAFPLAPPVQPSPPYGLIMLGVLALFVLAVWLVQRRKKARSKKELLDSTLSDPNAKPKK